MQQFKIGVITKPHGVRGEFKVFPTTDDSEGFNRLLNQEILLGEKKIKLEDARTHKGMVYIKLAGVDDRNSAEKFIGMDIFILKNQAAPLEEDEYFERDLIGMEVNSEDGKKMGHLEKIIYTPANDVYVIKPLDGKPFMIPAIKDVIKQVCVLEKKMTVKLLEGLVELTL